jgi:hypothetical protein
LARIGRSRVTINRCYGGTGATVWLQSEVIEDVTYVGTDPSEWSDAEIESSRSNALGSDALGGDGERFRARRGADRLRS